MQQFPGGKEVHVPLAWAGVISQLHWAREPGLLTFPRGVALALTCSIAQSCVLQLPLPPVQLLRLPVQLLLPLEQLSCGSCCCRLLTEREREGGTTQLTGSRNQLLPTLSKLRLNSTSPH